MKDLLSRVIGGFVIGVLIGQIVQIIISLQLDQREYVPVLDSFSTFFTNETTAVIAQIVLTGLIGVTFATSARLFDIATWSLLKQHAVHFMITASVWIPISSLLWTPSSRRSIMIFLVSFFFTYVITWVIQYAVSKKDIQQINEAIQLKKRQDGEE